MNAGILLLNTKFPHNVGAAIRAASIFGADILRWTGSRVADPASEAGGRIPREERMREYKRVDYGRQENMGYAVEEFVELGFEPVCVEVLPQSQPLQNFVHPVNAAYVFGPEDGSIMRGMRTACHHFVQVPSRSCMNLGAAVNVVLYDRCAKLGFPDD